MSSSVQLLETTGNALRDALSRRDWDAIGELDAQCRQAVDEAMVEAVRDEELLRDRLQALLDLYRELVITCQAEQNRVAAELVQLNQSQQGAKVYQLFS
ncbi:flagellar protein FliT [Pseudomonas sp. PDM16]|uniref:flagellar protein FliT n=1 Tax=Pseudomonas sp. PDM16 TaxID=2769292 RepID=UPI00177E35E8|nr:flagellar protein FliT [Pseudomonas sp. PDM16]MBD9416514.1 flagellar protein FliT [Pseudomonas sp. PDM16]